MTVAQFLAQYDPTKPVFIEPDGACVGNPGPYGWGAVVAQESRKIEAHDAKTLTSNNEMEFQAIDEVLTFLGSRRLYMVIDSDSQGCLDMMMGKGIIGRDRRVMQSRTGNLWRASPGNLAP
jgi:ribonuclease HI